MWPDNWRHEALREAGIPVSQHALDVLDAWQRSTPTQPWTNNPLGFSARLTGMPQALHTPYAVFPSHNEFRIEFKNVAHGIYGKPLIHALLDDGDLAGAWRVIRQLNLPAKLTESDYPSALLDMVEAKYTSNQGGANTARRKSVGPGVPSVSPHEPLVRAAVNTRKATADVKNLRSALDAIMKGLI